MDSIDHPEVSRPQQLVLKEVTALQLILISAIVLQDAEHRREREDLSRSHVRVQCHFFL